MSLNYEPSSEPLHIWQVLSDDGLEELAAHCKHLERLCLNAAGDMDVHSQPSN